MEVTIIKVVVAAIFSLAVVGKLTGKTKSTFEQAGFSPALMYATAITEIVLVIGLFTQYELLATLGLLAILGGALIALVRQKATLTHFALPMITVLILLALIGLQYAESTII